MTQRRDGMILTGHALMYEGLRVFRADGTEADTGLWRRKSKPGLHAKCECGEIAPLTQSRDVVRSWHSEHKAAVRSEAS